MKNLLNFDYIFTNPSFPTFTPFVPISSMESTGENSAKRRKSTGAEEDSLENCFDYLPHDLTVDIVSRLGISSLVPFTSVCRAWRSLLHDPDLVSLHLDRTARNNTCLIFHSDYPLRNQLCFVEFSDHNERAKVRKIQTPFRESMPEFNVIGSCDGLVCVSDSLYKDALYVFNPLTGKHMELPKSVQSEELYAVYGFGYNKINADYKLVKIAYYENAYYTIRGHRRFKTRERPHSEVQILSIGSTAWRSIGNAPYLLDKRSSEATVNGRLHWLSRPGRFSDSRRRIIVSFDLEDEQFREVQAPDSGALKRINYQLAVLGGRLAAAVRYINGALDIWVMKEYDVKESWVLEYEIGAHSPRFLGEYLMQAYRIWRSVLDGRIVRILCLLKNGEILLEYRGGTLVSYEPNTGNFTNLAFEGMPSLFQTVVHVGSLKWIT